MLDCKIIITAVVNRVLKVEHRTRCNAAESKSKQRIKKNIRGRKPATLSNLENAEQPTVTKTWKGHREKTSQS